MNLILTDHLACPRCGGPGGLVLLADRVEGRRVLAGQLGCPDCRAQFPVLDGVAVFADMAMAGSAVAAVEGAQLAALLGVSEGPAMMLLIGPYEAAAAAIAGLLSDVEMIVATPTPAHGPEREGVSVLQTGRRLPLRDRSMRGVMISGADHDMIAEAVRVAGVAARVVLLGATTESAAALRAQGVHVLAAQEDTLVVVRQF